MLCDVSAWHSVTTHVTTLLTSHIHRISSLGQEKCKLCQLYPLLVMGDGRLGRKMDASFIFISLQRHFPGDNMIVTSVPQGLSVSPTVSSVFTWETFWGLQSTPGSPDSLCEASCWSLHVTASLGSLLHKRYSKGRDGNHIKYWCVLLIWEGLMLAIFTKWCNRQRC